MLELLAELTMRPNDSTFGAAVLGAGGIPLLLLLLLEHQVSYATKQAMRDILLSLLPIAYLIT